MRRATQTTRGPSALGGLKLFLIAAGVLATSAVLTVVTAGPVGAQTDAGWCANHGGYKNEGDDQSLNVIVTCADGREFDTATGKDVTPTPLWPWAVGISALVVVVGLFGVARAKAHEPKAGSASSQAIVDRPL